MLLKSFRSPGRPSFAFSVRRPRRVLSSPAPRRDRRRAGSLFGAALFGLLLAGGTLGDLTLGGSAAAAEPAEKVDFNRDVRPILARHCFQCHGPDELRRESGLRLDTVEGAVAALDSGRRAIVPGRPESSELLVRVDASDPDVVMPPPATKKTLTAAERSTLRRWIAAGAEYQPHWAFQPPKQAPAPAVADRAWPRSPLDSLVLAPLEADRRRPSAEADRETLVRRLFLDLTGLPPSPDEADEFLFDSSPDAVERLVDRLLASPAYGERWARRWLDLARYADTNGYEKDRTRSIWPYRDWVIKSLNADLPFDRFTIEQIAGDMLPGATLDQRIATGFHRNTMINEEGGIDPLEFRYHAMVDRVNTTGTAWLGLTLGCANCHTHKYDPVPHREYFQLYAMLNNADEPELDVPSVELAERRAAIEREVEAKQRALESEFPPDGPLQWSVAKPLEARSADGSTLRIGDDLSLLAGGPLPARDVYTVEFETDGRPISALRLETLTDPSLGAGGPGRTPHGNFVLTELSVVAAPRDGSQPGRPVKIVRASADVEQPMFPVSAAFDGKPDSGWAVHHPSQPLNRPRTAEFHFEQPVSHAGGAKWTVVLQQHYGVQHLIGKFRLQFGRPADDARPVEQRRRDHLERKFAQWQAEQSSRATNWTVLRPTAVRSNLPLLTVLDDDSIRAGGDQSKSDWYELTFDLGGRPVTAIRIEALPDEGLPKKGPGRVYYEGPHGDFWLSDLKARADGAEPSSPLVDRPFARASQSFAAGGSNAAAAIDDNLQTGWSINGGQGRAHFAVFNLAQPLDGSRTLVLRLLFERYYAAGMGRLRISVADDPDAAASTLPPDVERALAEPAERRTAPARRRLLDYYLSVAPELAAARQAIDALRASAPPVPTTLVLQERPSGPRRPTYRHHRGEFLQPKEAVEPDVPKLLPPLPDGSPRDRLALARWLVSPDNPLVGRVTMNRHWGALFGRGIVRTTEDFGYQGESPSNPELLDWLAVELLRRDWSIKAMHRTIATSATYRQSSDASPDAAAFDPLNVRLARGPRLRLEAELVRDSLLKASGLLSNRLGGPSVFPPQPANVTTEGAYGGLNWQPSPGGDRYRRGLYTFAKRTAPYAMFLTFDGPSGEACVARRETSNTPLQALTLLNDPVLVEAAQALGRDAAEWRPALAADPRTLDDARLERLFRRCLVRRPTDDERTLLREFYTTQRGRFERGEADAQAVAGGEPSSGPLVDRAAWTTVARALLNVDELVTKP